MRRLETCVLVVCMVAAVAVLSGCGKRDHDDVIGEMVTTMEQMVDVVVQIKSPEDLKKNEAELKELDDKVQQLADEMGKLGEPSEDVKKEIEEKYEERLKKAAGKLEEARRANPELAKVIERFDLPGMAGGGN